MTVPKSMPISSARTCIWFVGILLVVVQLSVPFGLRNVMTQQLESSSCLTTTTTTTTTSTNHKQQQDNKNNHPSQQDKAQNTQTQLRSKEAIQLQQQLQQQFEHDLQEQQAKWLEEKNQLEQDWNMTLQNKQIQWWEEKKALEQYWNTTWTSLYDNLIHHEIKGDTIKQDQNEQATTTRRQSNKATIVNPQSNAIAVCLMLMDDNHYLIEWLAYHYHVLPMRRLIVHPDPASKTSPVPILNRWKGRINFTVWNNTDIYPHGGIHMKKLVGSHLNRQERFMQKCILTLNEEGQHWLLFTDTDEYTLVNPKARDPKDAMYNYGIDNTTSNWTVPLQSEAGSVLQVLNYVPQSTSSNTQQPQSTAFVLGGTETCRGITRKNFGTHESLNSTTQAAKHWNASHFQTHRWRFLDKQQPIGKFFIDLSRIDNDILRKNDPNIHRPVKAACPTSLMWSGDNVNGFVMYHYSGTLEQVLFRSNDKRQDNGTAYRTKRYYRDRKHNNQTQAPVIIQEWLGGFVKVVGVTEAKRLLEHVGQPQKAAYFHYKG